MREEMEGRRVSVDVREDGVGEAQEVEMRGDDIVAIDFRRWSLEVDRGWSIISLV